MDWWKKTIKAEAKKVYKKASQEVVVSQKEKKNDEEYAEYWKKFGEEERRWQYENTMKFAWIDIRTRIKWKFSTR
jgi:hypothetical protein